MKIRNPFSFKNSSGWKDNATKKEKFWWAVLLYLFITLVSSIVYEIFF